MSDTKIKTSNIGNLAVTHALLHTDMDLTSKTVQVATPTSNTHPATKLYVDTEVANLIDSAPGTLDTLNELAAAIGDDANFAATVTTGLSNKLPLAGGTMTGIIAGFESTGIDDNAANTSVTILSDGKVGIGIESPVRTLDVDSGIASDIARFGNNSGTYTLGYTTNLASIDLASSAGIRVRSGSTLALQTTSAGFVGIGDTTPSEKLDVNGNIRVPNLPAGGGITFHNNREMHIVGTDDGSYSHDKGLIISTLDYGSYGISMGIHTSGGLTSNLSNFTPQLRIDNNGNVGIGTESPSNLLTVDVNSATSTNDSISIRNRGITALAQAVGLRFQYNTAIPSAIRTTVTNLSSGAGRLGLFTSPDATAGNLSERLTILSGGNVGIGTTSPLADLHVEGNAVIGTITGYETTHPGESGATLHVHTTATDGADIDGKVNFGDEAQVIISTGAIDGGPQGYQGSLWFGTSDHPAGGSTLNAGTQWNWKVAGIASKTDQDTASENSAYGNLEFYTKGSNASTSAALAMTIDESQRVGIGTTSPSRLLHLYNTTVDPYLLIDGSGGNRDSGIIINAGGGERKVVRGDLGGSLYFGNSNQISLYNSNDVVINESGNNADFRVECPGEPYAIFLDSGEQRLFFGNSSTSENSSESMYIDVEPGNRHMFLAGNSREVLYINRNGTDGTSLVFRKSNVQVGGVSVTSSGTTYNTTSDRRLKDNIEPISDATDKLMDMKPVTHTWIDNPDEPQVHGFIAQEMQEVIPEAVSGDAESDEMMSMDYGRITPIIVAALQDALNEIKELKARIDELENK